MNKYARLLLRNKRLCKAVAQLKEQVRTETQARVKAEQEVGGLKAQVNELRDALKLTNTHRGHFGEEPWISDATALRALSENPAQSLATNNAAIEEEVIERCAEIADETIEYYTEEDIYAVATREGIRNQPRKYSGGVER